MLYGITLLLRKCFFLFWVFPPVTELLRIPPAPRVNRLATIPENLSVFSAVEKRSHHSIVLVCVRPTYNRRSSIKDCK